MAKIYPRVKGFRRNPKAEFDGKKNYGKPCIVCGVGTCGEKWLQTSYMRGDDELLRVCAKCWKKPDAEILDCWLKSVTDKNTVAWPLTNGVYETESGSRIEISGKHNGCSEVIFDWFEEKACIDCDPQAHPEEYGNNDVRLVWNCDYCGGGSAKLRKAKQR